MEGSGVRIRLENRPAGTPDLARQPRRHMIALRLVGRKRFRSASRLRVRALHHVEMSGLMQIDLRREDAEIVRDLLRNKIVELDKEINRTDGFAFKHELQLIDRAVERVVAVLSTALERAEPR
jgi:hypothetical protein